jgi:hypothetical protein
MMIMMMITIIMKMMIKMSSPMLRPMLAWHLILINVLLFNVEFILASSVKPTFDRTNENVTVIVGNTAVLPCFISNLGDHKVNTF